MNKLKTALSTMVPPVFDERNLVNFGPLTTEFSCLISTHPGSPLRLQCRLMRLRSDHATLPEAEFQPP